MTSNLEQTFLDTINPDPRKRIAAERHLEQLRTRPDFVLSLPKTYMAAQSPIVARISAIYYKNTVISQYSKSLAGHRKHIIGSVMEYMLQDRRNFEVHTEVLGHVFSVEQITDIPEILDCMVKFAESDDENAFRAAVAAMAIFIEKDKAKYRSAASMETVFERMGPAVLGKFAFYLRAKNYEFVKMIMTVFMQAHEGFNIPKFMTQIGNFSSIVGMATSILKDVTDAYDNWQARKCASSFLCKALNRSIKVYYKNKLMGEYILETARLTEIYSVVKLIFGSNKDTKETIYNAVEFILLLSAEAKYFPLIYDDIFFLIFEVILPSHVLSDEEQREFKEQPDAYLKSKYNYYANDIRCSAGALFAEIINQIAEKPELFSEIYNALFKIFIEHEQNPTHTSAVQKYAALYLIVNITDSIIKFRRDTLEVLINNVIYKDMDSLYPFLQSQCLYALQFFDGKMLENEYTVIALNRVLGFMTGNSEVLKVDAALTIPYFMNCPSAQETIRLNINLIIETLILMSNKYGLESLTDTLELIISSYPDEIASFAPQLTCTLSENVLEQLQKSDDRIMTISGFLRTISDLALSLTGQKTVLYQMYVKCYPAIFHILKNACADFYIETLDLISNFLYGFREVENSMWGLLLMILSIEKSEIINVSEELACLIDNYVTFGRCLLTGEYLEKIYQIIDCLCVQEEDYLFDDEFICGCRIIESLLLNMAYLGKDQQRIEFFISMVSANYENIDDGTTTIVYALEVIMHCMIVNSEETLKALKKLGLMIGLRDIHKYRKKFTRVHDKKILLIYVCAMMKIQIDQQEMGDIVSEINYTHLNEILLFAIETLPAAIEKREKLKADSNNNNDIQEDENMNDDYESDEVLEEDLTMETSLDSFDLYGYCKNVFANINNGCVGYEMIRLMSEEDKNVVASILR